MELDFDSILLQVNQTQGLSLNSRHSGVNLQGAPYIYSNTHQNRPQSEQTLTMNIMGQKPQVLTRKKMKLEEKKQGFIANKLQFLQPNRHLQTNYNQSENATVVKSYSQSQKDIAFKNINLSLEYDYPIFKPLNVFETLQEVIEGEIDCYQNLPQGFCFDKNTLISRCFNDENGFAFQENIGLNLEWLHLCIDTIKKRSIDEEGKAVCQKIFADYPILEEWYLYNQERMHNQTALENGQKQLGYDKPRQLKYKDKKSFDKTNLGQKLKEKQQKYRDHQTYRNQTANSNVKQDLWQTQYDMVSNLYDKRQNQTQQQKQTYSETRANQAKNGIKGGGRNK